MKQISLTLLMILGVSTLTSAQVAEYDLQELVIDVNWPVTDCEITLVVDDVYYPVESHQINGSIITLYLAEYQNYHLVIDCNDHIMISLLDRDIIDERDLSISADVDYQFEKGILVFNY